jgi:ABC-2 type transport system ATP-binding protein
MNAVEIRSLTKSFGAIKAVDGLTLDIGEGELFALLGVNGAGKTTTIKMLSGVLRPDGGDALIMGHSVLTELAAAKEAMNVSPQETAVAPNLTARENLELMAGIYGADRADARRAAEDMEGELGLSQVSDRRARTLSGGWQRRLSIAMALITRPKVLFLDEPTLGLDILARRELWREIEKLKGGTAVILTTHYLEEAEALADRIGVMTGGRLTAAGTAAELKAAAGKDSFEDAFVELASGGAQV